jgi:PAS domain-containing protein
LDLRQKIAEMKQTEAALTESYQKYLTLFRIVPNPAFVIDEDFHFRD